MYGAWNQKTNGKERKDMQGQSGAAKALAKKMFSHCSCLLTFSSVEQNIGS
jgi:hypothetical protein